MCHYALIVSNPKIGKWLNLFATFVLVCLLFGNRDSLFYLPRMHTVIDDQLSCVRYTVILMKSSNFLFFCLSER